MKFFVASVLLFGQLLCGHAQAETCDGIRPPSDRWVRDMTNDSEFVFFGTIISVENGNGGVQELQFHIIKQLKGSFGGTGFSSGWGPGFPLTPNEPRVFFVSPDKQLLSCSNYKYYFTDSGMQAEVLGVMKGT